MIIKYMNLYVNLIIVIVHYYDECDDFENRDKIFE